MKIRRKLHRYLLTVGVIIILAGVVPGVMAYEGHTINVKAHVKDYTTATRSPGWWNSRPNAQKHVLDLYLEENPDGLYMGWPDAPITNEHQTMGIFWADMAKEIDCDGKLITPPARDALCKARVQASFQVLAAILNSISPNGTALPISLEEIQAIMGGTDISQINDLHNLMAAFNRSRDFDEYTLCIPDTYLGTVNNPTAKAIAWEEFANCQVLVCGE